MDDYDLLIKNGTIVTGNETKQGDIVIKDGRIQGVFTNRGIDETKADQVIDAEGLHVLPGLIDSHVHFNEPGRTDWEGLATGSQSLVAGGVTTFFDMPLNSTPPVTDKEQLAIKRKLGSEKAVNNPKYWGGLVPGSVENLKEMHENGVIGFKAFLPPSGIDDFQNADDETLYRGMKEIASLGSILAVHAESPAICAVLAEEKLQAGKTSARDFVESRPIISEVEAVRRVISYAEATGCRLHIVHASNQSVVEVVQEAKMRGVDVTVETCPHYLTLTVKDLEEQGGVAKCTPPLRDQKEVDDLWDAVAYDEIDVIGSDHSPAPEDMKQITDNFFEGWGGISGAQSTLNNLLTEGYFNRRLPLQKIVELTSLNPAQRFGLTTKGTIASGFDADLTLVDLNERFELKKEDLFYRHKHSPYIGKSYQGNVKMTIVNGDIVYDNGKIIE